MKTLLGRLAAAAAFAMLFSIPAAVAAEGERPAAPKSPAIGEEGRIDPLRREVVERGPEAEAGVLLAAAARAEVLDVFLAQRLLGDDALHFHLHRLEIRRADGQCSRRARAKLWGMSQFGR